MCNSHKWDVKKMLNFGYLFGLLSFMTYIIILPIFIGLCQIYASVLMQKVVYTTFLLFHRRKDIWRPALDCPLQIVRKEKIL